MKKFILKAVSWAFLSFWIGLACHWLVDSHVSNTVAWGVFWFCLLKTPFYWAHDLAWKPRKAKQPSQARFPLPVVCVCQKRVAA